MLHRFSQRSSSPEKENTPEHGKPKKGIVKQLSDTSSSAPATPVTAEEKPRVKFNTAEDAKVRLIFTTQLSQNDVWRRAQAFLPGT